MPWTYEASPAFQQEAERLRDKYQKVALSKRISQIKDLEQPKKSDGAYAGCWAYFFAGSKKILCKIDEENKTVHFIHITN